MASIKESIEQWRSWMEDKLNEENQLTPYLSKIEKQTGVKRIYLAYGVIALLAIWLMVGYGAQLLCNFIGFIYPAYASIKAIESTEKDDDTQWLIYWVVYSVFALSELVTDVLFFWIPFYWFFKCLFLVWCMAPASCNGSQFVYYKVIRPYFLRYEGEIDQGIAKAKKVGGKLADKGTKLATDAAVKAATKSD